MGFPGLETSIITLRFDSVQGSITSRTNGVDAVTLPKRYVVMFADAVLFYFQAQQYTSVALPVERSIYMRWME